MNLIKSITMFDKLTFPCGKSMNNRFMLAPLTNEQSHDDGTLSEEEFRWLTMRAAGGFGLVMTCASHVQKIGQGFPGQLGIFDDKHEPGHQKLAKEIQSHGALAVVQLHHAGMRSPKHLIGTKPVCPSENDKTGARALNLEEVKTLGEDFIKAAVRAKKCGYDGVEIHGAHGYILSQFLSATINHRKDKYGGSFINRCRLINEIIHGVRTACGKDFLIGVRLSPEKFGMQLTEIKQLCEELIAKNQIDFLDISLWDYKKNPEEDTASGISLLEYFTNIKRKNVLLTVAGGIRSGADVQNILNEGVDFVTVGRAGILHHDFPKKMAEDPNFTPIENPVSEAYLKSQGLSDIFVNYMKRWPGFVE